MNKECIAMLLAGGQGKRLGVLTNKLAKPAVPFGGKYRIVDFALSNCTNSGISTVGILTQYQPLILHRYLGIGSNWGLDRQHGGTVVLPPYSEEKGGKWYNGTADAVCRNLAFIEYYNPDYVLIISGDHIYTMNYAHMLEFHKKKNADVTIAVNEVSWEEATRFGTVCTGERCNITGFEEKVKNPKSNLASMGIYIFKTAVLKKYLLKDEQNPKSSHDFGKDVIPLMLKEGVKMIAHHFHGYWKDVGTIDSLWQANMDLLVEKPGLDLYDPSWKIYTAGPNLPPQYVSPKAHIQHAIIGGGCRIAGNIKKSVLFYGITVGENTTIEDSVIMPYAKIGSNVTIRKSIIGARTIVEDGCKIGTLSSGKEDITIISRETIVCDHGDLATERQMKVLVGE